MASEVRKRTLSSSTSLPSRASLESYERPRVANASGAAPAVSVAVGLERKLISYQHDRFHAWLQQANNVAAASTSRMENMSGAVFRTAMPHDQSRRESPFGRSTRGSRLNSAANASPSHQVLPTLHSGVRDVGMPLHVLPGILTKDRSRRFSLVSPESSFTSRMLGWSRRGERGSVHTDTARRQRFSESAAKRGSLQSTSQRAQRLSEYGRRVDRKQLAQELAFEMGRSVPFNVARRGSADSGLQRKRERSSVSQPGGLRGLVGTLIGRGSTRTPTNDSDAWFTAGEEGVAGAGSPRSSGTPEAAAQPNVEASFVQFKVPAQHAAQEGGASDSDAETFRTLADAYRMGPAHGSQITRRKELRSSRTSSIVTSETLNVSVADADVMRRTWSAHNWAESPAQDEEEVMQDLCFAMLLEEEEEEEEAEDHAARILHVEFSEYHFQNVRLVVCAGILLWVLFTIPRLLEKVGLALDVKSMTHLYSYTFGEEFQLARSCAPLMRTVHTMVGTTLAQLLSMVVCMWMFLKNPFVNVNLPFLWGSFSLILAACSGMVEYQHVVFSSKVSVLYVLSCFPAILHLRTVHAVIAVTPPVLLMAVMTAAGQSADDNCTSPALILIVVGVVASLSTFQTAISELELRRLHENNQVQEEQLADQKKFLTHMLPPQALKFALNSNPTTVQGKEFNSGTIMMVDVNLEEAALVMSPSALVEGLDSVFIAFDVLVDKSPRAVYKVETIGSVYMVAGGVPSAHPDHAHLMLTAALQFQHATRNMRWTGQVAVRIRCGMHSGKVFAGVPGMVCPRYRFFGDTVNTSARLESMAPWTKIWLSDSTCKLLQTRPMIHGSDENEFDWGLVALGAYWFKGKGNLNVWEVDVSLPSAFQPVSPYYVDQVASSRNSTLEGNGEIAIGVGEALTLKEAASDARENLARILRSPTLRIQENQSVFTGGQVRWLVDWVLGKLQWVFRHPGFSNMHAALNRLANKFVSSAGGEAPFVAAEEAGGRNDPRPDIMDVNPFKDTEMRMLLTFRNPVLEHHYRYFRMHKREMVTFTGCFLSLVVLVWGAAVVAATECEGASVSETLLYSGVALAVAAGLLTPLMMKYRWTTHWWHVVSLLLMLTFMAWQLAMPCGSVIRNPSTHLGVVLVWILLAHTAFALPFRFFLFANVVPVLHFCLVATPEECSVSLLELWEEECDFTSHDHEHDTKNERNAIAFLLIPLAYTLYTCWYSEMSNRKQFIQIAQAHHRRRKVVSVVKSLLPEHVLQMENVGLDRSGRMLVNHHIPVVNQLFSDIVGFTSQAAQMKPIEVFEMIANLFGVFDESSTALGVQKIETIGDAYWARSGDVAGGKCLPKHATALALFGFKMQEEASKFHPLGVENPCLKIRVGLHSGPVIGGITGTSMPRYHLFGPHVSIANLMETLGSTDYLHVTRSFAELLNRDICKPADFDVVFKDLSILGSAGMPMCERLKWENVESNLAKAGKNLRLDKREIDMFTPVATITRQRTSYINIHLEAETDIDVRLTMRVTELTPEVLASRANTAASASSTIANALTLSTVTIRSLLTNRSVREGQRPRRHTFSSSSAQLIAPPTLSFEPSLHSALAARRIQSTEANGGRIAQAVGVRSHRPSLGLDGLESRNTLDDDDNLFQFDSAV